MRKLKYIRSLLFMVVATILAGCSATKAVIAMHRSTDDFHTLASDSRVKYEAGGEGIARIIAAQLDQAIHIVETKQYGKFARPVIVYVPATTDRFAEFCASPRRGGCVLNGRLFISPKKQNTPARLPRVLTHELSHLQMEQRLGMWKWHSNCPEWFREGLAVYISEGGGAEGVTEQQAVQAIRSGKALRPIATGSLLFPKTARDFGLSTHMFYRQAGLFVAWLHDQGDRQFRGLILQIQGGATLDAAVNAAYGDRLQDEWLKFTNSLNAGSPG